MNPINLLKIKKLFFTVLLISVTSIGVVHSHHFGAKGSSDESTIEDAVREFTENKNRDSGLKETLKILSK